MHGLINRSIQCFLLDIYGAETWQNVIASAAVGSDSFEALLTYDDDVTNQVLKAAAKTLEKPSNTILEDIGTYLVSHPNCEALRRLLRFGGATFSDFLYSLDDLPGRAKLAVPELEMPTLELRDGGPGNFTLFCTSRYSGFAHISIGILRAIADDYGALVLLEHVGVRSGVHNISIQVLETSFAAGRKFELGSPHV